jgi:hypothetical protein
MIELVECMIFKEYPKDSMCSYFIGRFEQCRKDRDIKILEGIKVWESEHMRGLDKNNRELYLRGLNMKLERLKGEYNKLPSTQSKQFKMAQIESEIQQIKWRMKNIRSTLKDLEKER